MLKGVILKYSYLDIHPEVATALSENKAVVALESTIISHGMPYPQNVETALKVEQVVRDSGATPATIAIISGRLKVGLSQEEIDLIAKEGHKVAKVSRRDFAFMVAQKAHGATTVASTMMIASMAGIKVFATGGIGGVHRDAEQTFDISADLQELAKTNVNVVCAGIKSILDLGLTLEYLETHGVPVIGYKTKMLPAFYSIESDFEVDYRLDSPEEIAEVINVRTTLGIAGGMVIANPIENQYSMPSDIINTAIEQALKEMDDTGVKGKASTPFLLAKVAELTGGDSLASNIELVLGNARLATQIAKNI